MIFSPILTIKHHIILILREPECGKYLLEVAISQRQRESGLRAYLITAVQRGKLEGGRQIGRFNAVLLPWVPDGGLVVLECRREVAGATQVVLSPPPISVKLLR
eukprot:TRINITY_DN38555_c0_g1_i1.p1 TRINITY_DN38555_c0_g1~~TRINITY_DN38555_c0_g1_i1.p1  ORF type:complete len:104 (+),score=10.04 TRINITY_DN38555_c0_g1_i1:166-477(+)